MDAELLGIKRGSDLGLQSKRFRTVREWRQVCHQHIQTGSSGAVVAAGLDIALGALPSCQRDVDCGHGCSALRRPARRRRRTPTPDGAKLRLGYPFGQIGYGTYGGVYFAVDRRARDGLRAKVLRGRIMYIPPLPGTKVSEEF